MISNRSLARAATLAVAVLALAMTAPMALAGTLNVVDTEQYNGTYGLDIGITDTTPTYVETDSPQSETRFRARFYVKSTLLNLGSGESIVVMSAVGGGNDQVRVIVEESGGLNYLFFEVRTDAGTYTKTATGVELPDGWRAVEIDWQASDGGDNGSLDFWMDGWTAAELSATGLSGLDNDQQSIDYARMGAVSGIQAGTTGNLMFDDFEAHRDTAIGLLSLFSDVPVGNWAWAYAHGIYAVGVIDPCAPGQFCPADYVDRASMAVYMGKGKNGEYYTPPGPYQGIFDDVPSDYPNALWIEAAYDDGLTSGCGGCAAGPLCYCPDRDVTREETAKWNLLAVHGGGWTPPITPTGTVFDDVTNPADWATPWIEQLEAEGLTTGCGGCAAGSYCYCPDRTVRTDEMGTFLTRMYDVPLPKAP